MNNTILMAVAVIGWIALYNLFWYLYEWLNPLEYRDVPVSNIGGHFFELYRRGDRGAEMVVTEKATGKTLRLRKWFRLGRRKITLDLIVDTLACGMPGASEALAILKEAGLDASYGIGGTRQYGNHVVCHCKDIDVAAKAVGIVFHGVWGCPRDALCAVKVRGTIAPDDKFVHGRMTWAEAHPNFFLPGKPYKRWQVPGVVYWAGRAAGFVWYRIRDMLCPPRGPGGDLHP